MTTPTHVALTLAVVGAALVTAAVRPGHPSVAPAAVTPPASARAAAVFLATTTPARPRSGAVQHRTVAAARRPAGRGANAHHTRRQVEQRPVPRARPHHRGPVRRSARHDVSGPTSWSALNAAIASIPTYRPGLVRWVVSNRYGHWGTADWYHAVLYVSPAVPPSYLYDVAVHEWSHELSALDYDADVSAAVAAMNRAFGGTGLVGAERAADCMSVLQGATWTHYTSCHDAVWRSRAARLVRGEQL